jgi:hypothetical protein
MQRIVQALADPQPGDGDYAIIGLAVPPQSLMTHVHGLRAILAVCTLVDRQHSRIMRGGRRVRE